MTTTTTTTTTREIVGTYYRKPFCNDGHRIAIQLRVNGEQVESRARSKADLRMRLKGYGFDAAAVAAAVPQD